MLGFEAYSFVNAHLFKVERVEDVIIKLDLEVVEIQCTLVDF